MFILSTNQSETKRNPNSLHTIQFDNTRQARNRQDTTRSKVIPTTTKTIKVNFHDTTKQQRTRQKYRHHNLTTRRITRTETTLQ